MCKANNQIYVTFTVIGGFLAEAKGWRWIFWFNLIVIGAHWLLTVTDILPSEPPCAILIYVLLRFRS